MYSFFLHPKLKSLDLFLMWLLILQDIAPEWRQALEDNPPWERNCPWLLFIFIVKYKVTWNCLLSNLKDKSKLVEMRFFLGMNILFPTLILVKIMANWPIRISFTKYFLNKVCFERYEGGLIWLDFVITGNKSHPHSNNMTFRHRRWRNPYTAVSMTCILPIVSIICFLNSHGFLKCFTCNILFVYDF